MTTQDTEAVAVAIVDGRTALGIELGSTRVKAVLLGPDYSPVAAGGHDWENQFVDGLWTYAIDDVWTAVQGAFRELAEQLRKTYGVELETVGALGVSAMMHGYLAFDSDGDLLTPFRTWRNTNTAVASDKLTEAFAQNIPHRWSIAHLYQAILDGEDHLDRLAEITTLAGYVHERLSGTAVLGVGDASGMFPIHAATRTYDAGLLARFDALARDAGHPVDLASLLPRTLLAGEDAGELSEDGARLLDPTGRLQAGAPMCPPEGDAGTGMVATNAVAPRTGNVSAGTSIFAMVVLERPLRAPHRELDLVTTPSGDPVAMVHCNNGASEVNAWVRLFGQAAEALGLTVSTAEVFQALFETARRGTSDCAGLMAYNYLSGEPITGVHEGRPMVLRSPEGRFDLATFMRTQLFSAFATLSIGMNVLLGEEKVDLERLLAHGGLFKTPGVAQEILAAAVDTAVSVGEVAAEGGAWGIAVLARFAADHRDETSADDLTTYLDRRVFADSSVTTVVPDADDVLGFKAFITRFRASLPLEEAAARYA